MNPVIQAGLSSLLKVAAGRGQRGVSGPGSHFCTLVISCNIEALIIRIGLGGILYYNNKEPPKPYSND